MRISDGVFPEGTLIASELSKLADAAQKGDRDSLMNFARSISLNLGKFSAYILARACAIKGSSTREKVIQDRLFRCAEALQNASIHVKILVSVKAASVQESRDTDNSLISLVSNLGDIMDASMDSLSSLRNLRVDC